MGIYEPTTEAVVSWVDQEPSKIIRYLGQMKVKKFLTFTHLTNLSKLLATKQLMKILQQQVSG